MSGPDERGRLTAIPSDRLTDAQQAIRERIENGPRGKISSPFEVMLHSSGLAAVLEQVGVYLRYQSAIPGWLREFAILIVCRQWEAGYEWSSHAPLVIAEGGADTLVRAAGDRAPEILADEDPLATKTYAFVIALLDGGHVNHDLYADMRAALGDVGLTDLVGLVGYYSALAMAINAHDVPPTPGTQLPWEGKNA